MSHKINRRELLSLTSTILTSRPTKLAAIASLSTIQTKPAFAKPGGCLILGEECLANFEIDYRGIEETVTLYLAGGGYASFDNVNDYNTFNLPSILSKNTVSMQWESDVKYAGNRPDWGLVSCRARVANKSDTRSGAILTSDSETELFPATMVNTLFCDIEIPNIGLRMFNKDPIVLVGRVKNTDSAAIQKDPRIATAGTGSLPKLVAAQLNSSTPVGFNPLGDHTLVDPVEFFDLENPEDRVAVLRSSRVTTFPHFGIEVSLVESNLDGRVVDLVWQVTNLEWSRTNEPIEAVWHVDDSYDLQIITTRQGEFSLADEPLHIGVQAINTNQHKALTGPEGIDPEKLIQKACLFCGVQNTPRSLDIADFKSGFGYTDIIELRARQ